MGTIDTKYSIYDVDSSGALPDDVSLYCMECVADSGDSNVYIRQVRSCWCRPSYAHTYFFLDANGLSSDGDQFKPIRLKDASGNEVASLTIINNGGSLEWIFEYYDGGIQVAGGDSSGAGNSLSANTWYSFELKYDDTDNTVEARLTDANLSLINSFSDTISGEIRKAYTIEVGIIDCTLTSETKAYFDRIRWKNDGWFITTGGTVEDSISLSEVLSNTKSTSTLISDSATLSEVLSNLKSTSAGSLDTVSLSEVFSILKTTSAAASDSASLSELISNIISVAEEASDTVSLSETFSGLKSTAAAGSDTVTLSEEITRFVTVVRNAIDSAVFSEPSILERAILQASAIQGLSLSEVITNRKDTSAASSDSVSLSELLYGGTLSDAFMADTASFSEVITRSLVLRASLLDSVTLSEAITPRKDTVVVHADDVALSEVITNIKSTSAAAGDTASFSTIEAVTAVLHALAEDGFTIYDFPTFFIITIAQITDTASFSDSVPISRIMAQALAQDGLDLSETISTQATLRALATDQAVFNEDSSRLIVTLAALSDSVVLTDEGQHVFNLVMMEDTVTLSELPTARKTARALVEDSLTLSELLSAIASGIQCLVEDQANFSDAIIALKNLQFDTVSDSVNFTEEGTIRVAFNAIVRDNIVLGEVISNLVSTMASVYDDVEFWDRTFEATFLPEGKVSVTVRLQSATVNITLQSLDTGFQLKKPGTTFTIK